MSQQNPIQEQIIAKAMKEETFRQELLSDPKAAIERELGISIQEDLTIAVHENTPTTLHLVLPAKVQMREMSDAELEQTTGGGMTPLDRFGQVTPI
jgi:hypothetical protein